MAKAALNGERTEGRNEDALDYGYDFFATA
jgi:hypothetical protein